MPIYEYECARCGRHVEEIQKFDDPPPISDDACPEAQTSSDGDVAVDRSNERKLMEAEQAKMNPPAVHCLFFRIPTTFTQRWDGTYNNDGRAGWVRQGDAMVRMTQGKNSTKYGEGL